MSRLAVSTFDSDFHKKYFYYLVSFYVFSFYGLWGPVLLHQLLLLTDADSSLIIQATRLQPLLAVPFAIVGWVLYGGLGFALPTIKPWSWTYRIFALAFSFLLPFGLAAWLFTEDAGWFRGTRWMQVLGVLSFLADSGFSLWLILQTVVRSKTETLSRRRVLLKFALLVAAALLIRALALFLFFAENWKPAVGLLLYFISGLLPYFYIDRNSDRVFIPAYPKATSNEKLELLYDRYAITPREREVIEKICEGKTNRQIAEELFISLQTVKDHTHRIYSKIGINSRLKLAQLIRE